MTAAITPAQRQYNHYSNEFDRLIEVFEECPLHADSVVQQVRNTAKLPLVHLADVHAWNRRIDERISVLVKDPLEGLIKDQMSITQNKMLVNKVSIAFREWSKKLGVRSSQTIVTIYSLVEISAQQKWLEDMKQEKQQWLFLKKELKDFMENMIVHLDYPQYQSIRIIDLLKHKDFQELEAHLKEFPLKLNHVTSLEYPRVAILGVEDFLKNKTTLTWLIEHGADVNYAIPIDSQSLCPAIFAALTLFDGEELLSIIRFLTSRGANHMLCATSTPWICEKACEAIVTRTDPELILHTLLECTKDTDLTDVPCTPYIYNNLVEMLIDRLLSCRPHYEYVLSAIRCAIVAIFHGIAYPSTLDGEASSYPLAEATRHQELFEKPVSFSKQEDLSIQLAVNMKKEEAHRVRYFRKQVNREMTITKITLPGVYAIFESYFYDANERITVARNLFERVTGLTPWIAKGRVEEEVEERVTVVQVVASNESSCGCTVQ